MECLERLTFAGRGWWGDHETDFALSTLRRTWHARYTSEMRSQDAYRLSFRLLEWAPNDRDMREFDTEAERQTFFDRAISHTAEHLPAASVLQGCVPRFAAWVGQVVSDVDIDFGLRMGIGDSYVVLEDVPVLRAKDATLDHHEAAYADAARALVGQRVVGTDVYLDDGLVISFPAVELVLTTDRMHRYQWPEEIEMAIGGGVIPPPIIT